MVDNRLKAILDRRMLITEVNLAQTPFELYVRCADAPFVECQELFVLGQPHLPVLFPIVFFGDVQLVSFDFAEFLPTIQGQFVESFGVTAACPCEEPGGDQADNSDLSSP